jgi:hypothetical protein
MSNTILLTEEQLKTEINSNVERLELYSENYPFNLSLRIKEFPDDKSLIRFVKSCEKNIRNCLEYKEWRNYIFDVLGITSCSLTFEDRNEVSLEIHHHLPSLFTIVKTLVNKKIAEESEFSSFDICLETITLHFQNKIGYIPLVTTVHEKLHNGHLNIPIELVKGNFRSFINEYWEYIDDIDKELITVRLSHNCKNCNSSGWIKNSYPGFGG